MNARIEQVVSSKKLVSATLLIVFLVSVLLPLTAAAAATCTTTFLTLDGSGDPNQANQGDAVAIASWTETGGTPCTGTSVTQGTVTVEAKGLKDDTIDPWQFFTCSGTGTGSKTAIYDDATPTPAGTEFDTTGFDVGTVYPVTVGITAEYRKATGPGSTNYASSNACIDLQILEETPLMGCSCEGLDPAIYIFADGASAVGTLPGDVFEGSFDIRVKNCLGETAENAKIQGGAAGWLIAGVDTTFGDWIYVEKNALPGKSPKKNDNGADSFTWWTDLGEEGEGQCKAIRISVAGKVANRESAGTVKFLSGPWSAVWNGTKSEYAGRVSFTVEDTP